MRQNNQNRERTKLKPIERQYRNILARLHRLKWTKSDTGADTQELEEEISWKIQRIEQYGFVFFANHYLFDEVRSLSKMAHQLEETMKANG